MGKLESTMKSEIERLAKRQLRKVSVPLKRDIRSLKITVSQLRKAILPLQRFTAGQQKELSKRGVELEVSPEEIKKSRFSPRLVKTLRKKLKITQKELAILAGVSMTAIQNWEAGKVSPRAEKKARLAALRKLGRTEVKKLLAQKTPEAPKGRRIKTKLFAKKEEIMVQKKAVKKVAGSQPEGGSSSSDESNGGRKLTSIYNRWDWGPDTIQVVCKKPKKVAKKSVKRTGKKALKKGRA